MGNRYSFSSSIFYIGYLIGCYPLTLLAQKFPTARVVSVLVTTWGICVLLTAVCFNYKGLYAQRFFLGFLESAVTPIFVLISVGPAVPRLFRLRFVTKPPNRAVGTRR